MRNLKKLLAVIVAICVLASFTVPAFAADETLSADTQVCKNIGMLIGPDANGVTAEYAATVPTRIQAAVLFLRLKGLEAEAKAFTGTENFADADKATWAKPIMAYLKANPVLGWVGDGTNFNPLATITAQEYYKVVLTALGYVQGTDFQYADTIAFAKATAKLAGAADVANFTVASVATATVEALKATVKGGTKTLAETLVEAGKLDAAKAEAAGLTALKATVAAIDVNKIEVKFNKAVETAPAITLKKGLVPYTTVNTLSEDKKSVTLTSSFTLPAGDYTVEIAGLDAKTVTVAEEKAVSLTIKSTSFQILDKAPISLALVNQYGKEMTLVRDQFTITAFNATKGTNVVVDAAKFELNAAAAAKDDKVVVSVVYKTGLTAISTIPVINASSASSFTFGSVVMPKDQTRVYEGNTGVVINYTMKDQYGNDMTLPKNTASANSAIGLVTFVSTNTAVANPADFATDADGKLTFKAGTEGTATITSLVVATGSVSTVVVTVDKKSAVKTLTVSVPAVLIAAGEDVTIPYVAVDQFGAQIAAKDIAAGDIEKVSFASSNAAVIKVADLDFGDANKLTLRATGAGTAVVYVYFNGVLQNSVTFTVNAKAVATRITGVKDLPAIFEADANAKADFAFANLTVVDQYNRAFTLDAETITVTPKDAKADVITVNAADKAVEFAKAGKATFAGTSTVGNEVFTIAIKDVAGSSIDYTLSTVATKDITSYTLAIDPAKIYKSATASYFATPALTGKTAAGDKVNLVPGKVTAYTSNNPAVAAINAGKVEGKAVGTATIAAWNGATKLAETTVTVVDAAPVATTVAIDNDPAITVVAGDTVDMAALLTVKDQYGVDVTGVAAAFADGIWTYSDAAKATVDADGLLTAKAAGEVTIGYVTKNGIVTTVTVTVTAAPAV